MRTLEQIQQEHDSIKSILEWETVTEESLLALDFPDDAHFVQFTGRLNNCFVRGRLTRDRGGNVSISIDETLFPCDLNYRLTMLYREAGEVFLSI